MTKQIIIFVKFDIKWKILPGDNVLKHTQASLGLEQGASWNSYFTPSFTKLLLELTPTSFGVRAERACRWPPMRRNLVWCRRDGNRRDMVEK